MKPNTGARYEIAIDGKPRSYRDLKPIAIEAAEYLKGKNPNAAITVRDLDSGEAVIIKSPPAEIRR